MVKQPVQEKRGREDIQSVLKAIDVLEALSRSPFAMSITKISQETGIPSPTVYRVLTTLSTRGYVVKNARREYALGASVFSLSVMGAGSAGSLMEESLVRIADETGESASVAVKDRSEVLYVGHKSSSRAMRLFTSVGNRAPLHATGVGKALLAAMDDDELDELLQEMSLTPFTPYTLTSVAALKKDVQEIRRKGYAVDNQEQELGVRCVAACIPSMPGFAASISGPPSRMTDEFLENTALPTLASGVAELDVIMNGRA